MSSAAFGRLLERLGGDRERGAEAYEQLRRALMKFFDWRGVREPDACADETIDRLARKLEEGTAIDDVAKYARGIARLVLLEEQRAPAMKSLDDHSAAAVEPFVRDDPGNARHACLDRCLDELPVDGRSLVLDYYAGERTAKIANRRRMASVLRLSENALRSRVQRLRERLEKCVHACLDASGDV